MQATREAGNESGLVVLATGIVPQKPAIPLNLKPGGFLADEQQEGIYPVACSKKPMDVSTSVKDSTAAALKAIQLP